MMGDKKMVKQTKPKQESSRNFRCNDRLWQLVTKKAKADGIAVSEIIRAALVEYVTK